MISRTIGVWRSSRVVPTMVRYTLWGATKKHSTFYSVHSVLLGLGPFCMMVLVATAILTCFILCFPTDDEADFYYAFDDDEKRNPLDAWDDDKIQKEKKCRRTSWHRDLPINCNNVHEFNFEAHIRGGDTKFLG